MVGLTPNLEFGDWIPAGFQVHRARRPSRTSPAWARSHDEIGRKLLAAATRRARVAYLFWCVGLTAKETAAELSMSTKAVECVLQRLRKL